MGCHDARIVVHLQQLRPGAGRRRRALADLAGGTPVAEGRAMRVTVFVRRRPDAGLVQAYCPDVPGCSSCGKTEDEALALLRRRLAAQLATDKTPPAGVRVVALEIG
jgi:hypothetical protein